MNRALTLLMLGGVLTCASLAQSGSSSERVRLTRNDKGEILVQVNATEPLSLADLKNEEVIRDGVKLAAIDGALSLNASRRPVAFETDEIEGEIGPGSSLDLSFPDEHNATFQTGKTNSQPIRLTFPDSGKVELPAAAKGRVELFGNSTYLFTGSSNVVGVTADGIPVRFSRHTPMMTGGAMTEQIDARGIPRVMRQTAIARIDLAGDLSREVQLAGKPLSPGQEKLITLGNGAQILVKHDAGKAALDFKILRGGAQFHIAGFSCWKTLAGSGQSGTIQWNAARRVVDVKMDAGAEGWTVTQLSGRFSASTSPGATFQYAQFQDCGSFSTSAIGDVVLFDRETGESIPVEKGMVSYNEGERVRGEKITSGKPFRPVEVIWESNDRVQVRGGGTTYPVVAGVEQSLDFGTDQLTVGYRTDGSFLLRAAEGNFLIMPAFVPEISFELPEGGALILTLNRTRHLFGAQAPQESGAEVRVISGGKTYIYLAPGQARVNVVLGQKRNSLSPEGVPAWIFFEGAGGDQTFLSGQQPARLLTPSRIEADRIVQEPVSVIE